MNYDFDKIVSRRGSNDIKHCALKKEFGRDDLTALWVADMEFETPDFITEALRKRLEHSLFGYTMPPEDYWPTVIKWVSDRHQWAVSPDWLTYIPGIVKGIGMVINVFTKPGDKIIIQPPVYHPFRLVPEANAREVVYNPLRQLPDGSYEMDFDNLERVCDDGCKLLILCNPHNPAGICWPRETLKRLADFCKAHDVLVISDEIHCDMALFGHKHIPFASVSDNAAQCSITFQAPSKTFNIAGIVSSYAIVPNPEIRRKFFGWLNANEFNAPDIFAPIATIAAFSNGEEWRQQMLRYVEGNIMAVEDFLREHIPQIRPLRPQASFLVWLDCRGLHLSHKQLIHLFVDEARLALNDGAMFGKEGSGFMRLNVGEPREMLLKALEQLEAAVKKNAYI